MTIRLLSQHFYHAIYNISKKRYNGPRHLSRVSFYTYRVLLNAAPSYIRAVERVPATCTGPHFANAAQIFAWILKICAQIGHL